MVQYVVTLIISAVEKLLLSDQNIYRVIQEPAMLYV
jgi:hypothetical protein